ncbi:MAG: hypothetical protein Q8900_02700 [Bacillota bacterium]|nr:hypothetical protein [Bacillota bacterium]
MDTFKLDDIKNVHVGDIPAAKRGIIDALSGEDINKKSIPDDHMSSYVKGHEIGTEIDNLLKGDQRDY